MVAKATGVIMTTMKLKIQFADVDRAFAGARIRSGTISAGYSLDNMLLVTPFDQTQLVTYQVIPSQPIAKKVLKINKKAAATMPGPVPPTDVQAANTTIESDWPTAPKSMSWRRPNFSIVKTAIQEAIKYSVPLQAARIREMKGVRPMLFWYMVAA